ncbi:AMP-dependent synthetase/ligase [Sulfuriflexus mobilis]|uniref:AMP-dependent synthetase/ligase n=1 Tax=Sulfuriflexus mobilis TaxID=1811807 RepID=UPI000F834F11|nr:long-chain fatty acid--CoA ligase [Sulfuriflexus mobilis]
MPQDEDLISADSAGTLDGLFYTRSQRSPDAIAYRQFDKASGEWQAFNWRTVAEQVSCWQQAIQAEDIQSGERVALLMRNSIEWVMAEQAALGLGLVIVPLYCDDRPDNIAYILEDSAARILIANNSMWRRVSDACADVTSLKCVVTVGSGEHKASNEAGEPHVFAAREWLAKTPRALQKRQADPNALATIVYTSGTTGRPKGVMLSHYNILSIAHSALITYSIYTDDEFLSFLPLSHTFERTVGYYLPMMAGASVDYARSVALLAEDLQQLRPTAMIVVPRIFERFHSRIRQQLEQKSVIARSLFKLATHTGWWRFQQQQGRGRVLPSLIAFMLNPLLDKLVAEKVRQRMGGRLRLAVSGGAALPLTVARTMIGMGITVTQGYGLTETSPVICGNPLDDNDPASVGIPLRGVTPRIGENDELLVKSPGTMLGYWNNHAATAQMIDAEGWLHTGDQARIINNHIYITGRIKDILVLSNGEKLPPTDIENTLCMEPLYEQVMVVGEGQSFLGAIIVLNREEWIILANKLLIDPYKEESLHDTALHHHITAHLRKLLHEFPGCAKIRRVVLTLEPWTIDNGLLTPTMKVKRNKVLEQFQTAVDALYR